MAGEILCKHWLGPSKYSRILKKKKIKTIKRVFRNQNFTVSKLLLIATLPFI